VTQGSQIGSDGSGWTLLAAVPRFPVSQR